MFILLAVDVSKVVWDEWKTVNIWSDAMLVKLFSQYMQNKQNTDRKKWKAKRATIEIKILCP